MRGIELSSLALSVDELIRFTCLTGDIGRLTPHTVTPIPSPTKALLAKLTPQGSLYVPNVPLQGTFSGDGITYYLSGCADAVIESAHDAVSVDVRRAVSLPPEKLPASVHAMLLATGRCLAYLYLESQGLSEIKITLSYWLRSENRLFRTEETDSREMLASYLESLLRAFSPFSEAELERAFPLRDRLRDMPFPFTTRRPGQKDMVVEAFRTFEKGGRLFVCAPTGIGKTMSALYPALKSVGTGSADKIFYLCAKTVTEEQVIASLSHCGIPSLRALILTSKEHMCSLESKGRFSPEQCHPRTCASALGHYERTRSALLELLASDDRCYTPRRIRETAAHFGVCPYELSLDLSEFCTLIVCDYNYVFSPRVRLRRYFEAGGNGERFLFLIDEAHNLVQRSREIFSGTISSHEISELTGLTAEIREAAEGLLARLRAAADLVTETVELSEENGNTVSSGVAVVPALPDGFADGVRTLGQAIWSVLRQMEPGEISSMLVDRYYRLKEYVDLSERMDDRYCAVITRRGEETEIKIFCLDPSKDLSEMLDLARGTVFFSATLTPLEYYEHLLSGPDSAETMQLDSPFDPERLLVCVADKFSTRTGDRERSQAALCDMIAGAVASKKGNYIAYFPSYAYMNAVYRKFVKRYPNVETVLQKSDADPAQRRAFLASFKKDGARRVFFCVLGGLYAEGIDLVGEKLIGVIIVGVGLPQLSDEGNILQEYFDRKYEAGFDYAYRYPAMNRVLQAAGRVIRTETDRGIVVLVDDRYTEPGYRNLFPSNWSNCYYVGDAVSMREAVRLFWENEGGNMP